MIKPITKAIFPVAGLGTRFLPATKASPKEMLTVVDKPLIQYAVEEAVAAGIKELIFVTSGSKRAIEDHFDTNYELEAKLKEKQQMALLKSVQTILPPDVQCVYVRQSEALGLGHAVLCAEKLIGDEYFAVLLADDLIQTSGNIQPCLSQMVKEHQKHQGSVLAVQTVRPSETNQYGIVSLSEFEKQRISQIIEKPSPENAPSNIAVVGRYILHPEIFSFLRNIKTGSGGEIQLTDGIAELLKIHPVYATLFQGQRYDCGNKVGYLQANFEYAISHPEFGPACLSYLKKRLIELGVVKAC